MAVFLGIVRKKRDPRIQDPGFFRAKLGKILKIRKNTLKIRISTQNLEKYKKKLENIPKKFRKNTPKNSEKYSEKLGKNTPNAQA